MTPQRFWLLLALCVFQYLLLARTTYARVVAELRTAMWMAPSVVHVGLGLAAGLL